MGIGEHIRFHPQILECAGHYHFAPQPCAVARGNEKGRVERMIQYLRHAFFAERAARRAARAQAWFEWRRFGRSLPALVGLVRGRR